MSLGKFLTVAIGLAFTGSLASAGELSFTCGATIDAATCSYLNTSVASDYGRSFSNANADIYIQYGTTGLASSTTGADNQVTYSQYAAALTSTAAASGNAVQISAAAALTKYDASLYENGNVDLSSALANALGISGRTPSPICST